MRKGTTKVMHGRNASYIQEELGGTVRVFKQDEWQKELARREKLTPEEWNEEVSTPEEDDGEEVKLTMPKQVSTPATPKVAGTKKPAATKKSAAKKVAKKVAKK